MQRLTTLILLLPIVMCGKINRLDGQTFQHIYGNFNENFFDQVLQDGSDYFVLGQDISSPGGLSHATVSQINSTGQHLATIALPFPSIWNDAVVISSGGGLIVVGSTVPINASSASLIARFSTSPFQLQWLHQYDGNGRDAFTCIVENNIAPSPDPFYVLGYETEAGGSVLEEDVVLMNFNASGTLNWKSIYPQVGDDEFVHDFETDGNGIMYMCGNNNFSNGIIYTIDQTGTMTGGTQITLRLFRDLEVRPGGIYAVSQQANGTEDYITKFTPGLQLLWNYQATGMNDLYQVWEGSPGNLYVTGNHNQGDVIMKIMEAGPTIDWIKNPSIGTNASNGSSWWLSGSQIGYIDGRIVNSVGFGSEDAFLSISDQELNGCMIASATASLTQRNSTSVTPTLLTQQSVIPLPAPTILTQTLPLDWNQNIACDSCVCSSDQVVSGITLTYQGTDIPLLCLPHGAQPPVLDCPTGDLLISGLFGCESLYSGELCAETAVQYLLMDQQFNTLDGGFTTNFPSLTFPQSLFSNPGTYYLTLSTLCPGAQDSCVCTMDWIVDCGECCLDFDLFCQRIEDSTTILIDQNLCKVTFDIGQLPDCDSIAYVDWGDGHTDQGNFGSGSNPMHIYSGSGTYYISYLAFEINPLTGFFCFEKLLQDTITIQCSTPMDSCIATCPTRQWNQVSTDYFIYDMTVFQGKLIVGGAFNFNNANHIAAWDGNTWSLLGTGLNGHVRALAVYNGALYAGGSFTLAGNTPVNGIAKWDGTNWQDVGGGVQGNVLSLQVFSSGLAVGGSFPMAGGNPANNIALWNGGTWSAIGSGMNGPVHGLGLYNGNLVAGGVFSTPGNNVALWNGSSWASLGNGINMINGNVFQGVKAIMQYGADLIVGGRFMDASGVPGTQHIAKWNNTSWSTMASGVNTSFEGLYDLILFDGALYAGGLFTQIGGNPISGVAKWDGSGWTDVLHQNQLVWALAEYQAPGTSSSCNLYSGGEVFLNVWDCLTGLQNPLQSEVKLFPNPNHGQFMLELSDITSDDLVILIHDFSGKFVESHRLSDYTQGNIEVKTNLVQGLYSLQVKAEGQILARGRFVIQ